MKRPSSKSSSRQHTAFLTVNLALIRASEAALTSHHTEAHARRTQDEVHADDANEDPERHVERKAPVEVGSGRLGCGQMLTNAPSIAQPKGQCRHEAFMEVGAEATGTLLKVG